MCHGVERFLLAPAWHRKDSLHRRALNRDKVNEAAVGCGHVEIEVNTRQQFARGIYLA